MKRNWRKSDLKGYKMCFMIIYNFLFYRKRRKLLKEKRKLRDKLALKMENPNDTHDFDLQGDKSLFSLNKIKTKQVSLCVIPVCIN